jgi:hypothetical protein
MLLFGLHVVGKGRSDRTINHWWEVEVTEYRLRLYEQLQLQQRFFTSKHDDLIFESSGI